MSTVLNGPLVNVPHDAWWISIVFMYLTLPFSLIQGVLIGLVPSLFVCASVGTCCIPCSDKLCSIMGSVLMGRPFLMAWTWWRYLIAGLVGLFAQGKSRLALFIWEWKAFGSGQWWWHGEGIWCWSYEDCERILQSQQNRAPAFGCVRACCPDMFPTSLLIFLSNGPGTEWEAVRNAVHGALLDAGSAEVKQRMAALPQRLAEDWKQPKLEDMNDTPRVNRMVSKCVFFVLFGKWITDEEAIVLSAWRSNAGVFILPRIVQRAICNIKIREVKKLRAASVAIVEKYGLQQVFVDMNNRLGQWKRQSVVQLCDEIVFGVGFAGIGGTSAACETVAAFLQCKMPGESPAKYIKWGSYDTAAKMVEKYKQNSEAYIKEALRMDPPVTSATNALKEETKVMLKGKERTMPAGLLNQYVVSMANRDPKVFQDPEIFNPDRENLNKAFTWNGAFGAENEASFPRICPGRSLGLGITQALMDHALRISPPSGDV